MGRHHPTEVRDVLALRLAPVERQLLERALQLKYPLTVWGRRRHSLGEFIREAACSIAHQVIQAAPPPVDDRQVDLEDLIAEHGGPRASPLRWKSKPEGVAWAPSPVEAAEYVVKPERRRDGTTWWLELHHAQTRRSPARTERLARFPSKQAAVAAADARVRLALRTRPAAPSKRAAGAGRQGGRS